jgi:hypothetical protein
VRRIQGKASGAGKRNTGHSPGKYMMDNITDFFDKLARVGEIVEEQRSFCRLTSR